MPNTTRWQDIKIGERFIFRGKKYAKAGDWCAMDEDYHVWTFYPDNVVVLMPDGWDRVSA